MPRGLIDDSEGGIADEGADDDGFEDDMPFCFFQSHIYCNTTRFFTKNCENLLKIGVFCDIIICVLFSSNGGIRWQYRMISSGNFLLIRK